MTTDPVARSFFRAGSIVLWTIIIVVASVVVLCCGILAAGGMVGSTVDLDPSSVPTP